jgi:hypothetical protein
MSDETTKPTRGRPRAYEATTGARITPRLADLAALAGAAPRPDLAPAPRRGVPAGQTYMLAARFSETWRAAVRQLQAQPHYSRAGVRELMAEAFTALFEKNGIRAPGIDE